MRRNSKKHKEEQARLRKLYITPRKKVRKTSFMSHKRHYAKECGHRAYAYLGSTECHHCPLWYNDGEDRCPSCGADNPTYKNTNIVYGDIVKDG